ncbi:hypothetical protein H4R33_006562 [Dimargaris cristalligena]|nr:hypothetical protein H4R33_006562 [Dimargaris cristalligena]
MSQDSPKPAQPAPTHDLAVVLENYLTGPGLNDQFTMKEFKSFFPSVYWSHKHVKDLFLTYQAWRENIKDLVKQSIIEGIEDEDLLPSYPKEVPQEPKPLGLDSGVNANLTDTRLVSIQDAITYLEDASTEITSLVQQLDSECNSYLEAIQA